MSEKPLVSVLIITYNHEKYIEQAIQGALDQVTNFPFEIVIGEDASTDLTRGICKQFIAKYPDRIRLLLNSQNLGPKSNFIKTLQACHGKYIALCEGDDYWDIKDKLQFQFDFLENNPDYVLIGGYGKQILESESYQLIHDMRPVMNDFDVTTRYLINYNPFSTVTVFFKNDLVKIFPQVYFSGPGGDRRLYLLLSDFGKCRYVNRSLGVYRVHSKGLSSRGFGSFEKERKVIRERIEVTKQWNKYFDFRFNEESSVALKALKRKLIQTYLRQFQSIFKSLISKI